jgi:hypothetical protein
VEIRANRVIGKDSFARTPELEKPYFVAQMGWAAAAAAVRSRSAAEEIAKQEKARAQEAEAQVRELIAERSEAWGKKKKEKRREQQQIKATERNQNDPKHIRKRLRQAKQRKKKKS